MFWHSRNNNTLRDIPLLRLIITKTFSVYNSYHLELQKLDKTNTMKVKSTTSVQTTLTMNNFFKELVKMNGYLKINRGKSDQILC